jgi:hypothetical protein
MVINRILTIVWEILRLIVLTIFIYSLLKENHENVNFFIILILWKNVNYPSLESLFEWKLKCRIFYEEKSIFEEENHRIRGRKNIRL